jgi:hypothetical protein
MVNPRLEVPRTIPPVLGPLLPSNTDRLTNNVTLWQKFPECQIFKGLRLAALASEHCRQRHRTQLVGGSGSTRRLRKRMAAQGRYVAASPL